MPRYVDEMITRFLTEGLESSVKAFDKMAEGAGKYNTHFRAAMEYAVPKMGQWGDTARMATNEWGVLYRESEKVGSTFDSLAKKQGLDPAAIASLHKYAEGMIQVAGVDDEDVLQGMSKLFSFGFSDADKLMALMPAIAAQARDYGMSMDESAKMVGKAVSSGNVGALTKSGVLTLDLETRAAVEKAQALLKSGDATKYAAGQQIMFNLIMQNATKYASDNAAFMATSAGKMQAFAERSENVKESLGEGATKVNEYKRELAGLFLTLGDGHPAMTRFAGGAVQITGDVLKVVGAIGEWGHGTLEIVRFMKMSKAGADAASLAKKGLAAATKADAAAEIAKTGVAKSEATALLGTANAAKAAAAAKGGLAAGFMGRGLTLGGGLMAGGAGAGLGYLGAGMAGTGGWQSAGAGAGSVLASAAAGAAAGGPYGAIIGGAAALGTGLYRLGAETHALNEQAKRDRKEFGNPEDADPRFAAMYARSRARVQAQRQGGDLHLTVRGAGLGNQQARDYVNLR